MRKLEEIKGLASKSLWVQSQQTAIAEIATEKHISPRVQPHFLQLGKDNVNQGFRGLVIRILNENGNRAMSARAIIRKVKAIHAGSATVYNYQSAHTWLSQHLQNQGVVIRTGERGSYVYSLAPEFAQKSA